MYRINQVTLPIDFDKNQLPYYLSKKLKINIETLKKVELFRLSIDARDKDNLCYKAGIVFDINGKFDYKRFKNVEPYEKEKDEVSPWITEKKKIVIVGSGPSGLFAGLRLAESGADVTIIERGYEMSKRKIAVDKMMKEGVLDTTSNIQFGEGGAGTFSDGKLNTGIKSKHISTVLETFHKFGADENILYDARPHIGTDVLSGVIVNMREYFISLGGNVLFEHKLTRVEEGELGKVELTIDTPNGQVKTSCDILILAIGHSSRDTIRMLYDKKLEIKQKPFSLGYRIEHLQEDVNIAQYGVSKDAIKLPPADYHLVEHVGDRVVYSFCMCPGGVVVPATSEEGSVVTNGMSYNARDGKNANSALLVSVGTNDFPSSHPLSGIELQEKYERYAYEKSGGYHAIVQKVGDFLLGKPSTTIGRVKPTYIPGYKLGSVEDMLPDFVVNSIKEALPRLGKKLKGFDNSDAILTGVETRSSAPFQVVRGKDMQTNIDNVYAIGEGAGWAGGIVSSAVEGIKCADIIISKYN
jgi:uncharacterized FAD-dependent dehydrogenase